MYVEEVTLQMKFKHKYITDTVNNVINNNNAGLVT